MSSANKPFRAIIVGGGPSGLVLAHCLNAAGIDFVLLERRSVLIEPSGAGLGVWPGCARLLDQLGLYDKAMKLCKPMTSFTSLNPDGSVLTRLPLYSVMGEKFGYHFLGYDRHEFFQMLYDTLPNKDAIKTGVRVVGVEEDDNHIYAVMEDGTRETGDILVGADGIHSTIARSLPGWSEKNFNAAYLGIWGISSLPPGSPPHEMFVAHDTGFSFQSLAQTDKAMWITYIKLDPVIKEPVYYSDAEMEKVVQQYFNVTIGAGCTYKDMWDHRIRAKMTTLDEGIQQTWYHGRVVLVGDAVHKFTPNLANGFNNAFESAAALTNQLHAMLHSPTISGTETSPTLEDITTAFSAYKKARFPRVLEQYKLSHWHLRFITWNTWITKWNNKLFSRIIPESAMMKQVLEPFKGVGRLEFLKMPKREKGWGAFDDERDQKAAWDLGTIVAIGFALSIGLVVYNLLRPGFVD